MKASSASHCWFTGSSAQFCSAYACSSNAFIFPKCDWLIVLALCQIIIYLGGTYLFLQFRPVVPTQQSQQFISMPSQHYQHQPVGPGGVPLIGVGIPPQNQQPQFSQPIQQLPPRPSPQLPPPSQAIPMPVARPNMHIPSESMMQQSDSQAHSQAPNGYTPGLGGPGMPLSSSYTVKSWLVCCICNG